MSREKSIAKERLKKGLVRGSVYLFVWAGVATLYYIIFSLFFDTPIEHEVRKVNDNLRTEYELLSAKYDSLEVVLSNVVDRDKNVYSMLFGAEPYAPEQQQSSNIDSLIAMTNNELASQFFGKLSAVTKRINRGSSEFALLQESLEERASKLAYIPSIQPVTNHELTKLAASYGMRIHPFYRTLIAHQGVDYAVPEDTRVYATADGRVKYVKQVHQSNGLSVIIDHGNGYETVYSHLERALVKRGERVKRGDIIARSGNSGLSFMPHLHYEVVYKGVRQDPINYFYGELNPEEYSRIIEIAQMGMQSLD